MGQRTDVFDLGRLALSAGEARRLRLDVALEPLTLGGQDYAAAPVRVDVDVSRTMSGWALRLRAEVPLGGPCMRCLEAAERRVSLDAREVDQPGGGDETSSPYVEGSDLLLAAWVRDAVALALPGRIVCDDACRGLCETCGANLNEHPGHAHERAPDPRWAKLGELRLE